MDGFQFNTCGDVELRLDGGQNTITYGQLRVKNATRVSSWHNISVDVGGAIANHNTGPTVFSYVDDAGGTGSQDSSNYQLGAYNYHASVATYTPLQLYGKWIDFKANTYGLKMNSTSFLDAVRNASLYSVQFDESSSLTNPATLYRYTINAGTFGTLTRDSADAYLTSNVYYNTSDQWIAKYTTSNAAGYMSFLGGELRWTSNGASVTAVGVVTGMTDRFRIEPDGDTYLITGALYMNTTEVISNARVGSF